MRVLVTGGAGFIGSNLVEALITRGDAVRVLDNFSTGHRHNLDQLDGQFELVEGDLRSYERVNHAVRGCEVVFHQGALPSVPRSVQDPLTTSEINVGGTLNVLLTARDEGVRRLIFASSSSIYGDAPGFPRQEAAAPLPKAPYPVAKLAAEQYCRVFWSVYGLETVCLRYFNVFGRNQDPASQYSAVIPRFIFAMREGHSPTIHGTGRQARDFTHIANVVAANLLALQAPDAAGRVFNIACGRAHSLLELVDVLNRVLDTHIEPVFDSPRLGDVDRSWADISQAQAVLGYTPEVDLEEGLRRTLASYEERLQAAEASSAGRPFG